MRRRSYDECLCVFCASNRDRKFIKRWTVRLDRIQDKNEIEAQLDDYCNGVDPD